MHVCGRFIVLCGRCRDMHANSFGNIYIIRPHGSHPQNLIIGRRRFLVDLCLQKWPTVVKLATLSSTKRGKVILTFLLEKFPFNSSRI